MTRLTVLGGSAAGVGTGQGCSGYLVQNDNSNLVIDLGPGTLLELRKHTDFRRLDGIVISHLHLDHVLDLFALRFALKYNPQPAPHPTPLHLPPDGLTFMERAAGLFVTSGEDTSDYFSSVFDLHEYDPDSELSIGDFTLTFAPTAHVVPCWAIRVHSTAATDDLFYTADTGTDADLDPIAAGAAVVIAEAAMPPDSDPERIGSLHLTPQQAGAIAERAGARHLVLAHIWEELGPESFAEAARAHFSGQLAIATPGLSFSW